METRNILLTIEYDGTNFHGWQKQPGARTVQETLEEAISSVVGGNVRLTGVSRTDAGVHALGQRAAFSGVFGIPTGRIPGAVNRRLAGRAASPGPDSDVRIVGACDVPMTFHPRFDAVGKTYRYRIRNEADMPVFLRNYRFHVPAPLDIGAMREAAAVLVGTHDFKCFEAAGSYPRDTTVRTIRSLDILEDCSSGGRDIDLEVTGDGFLYHMVRNIAGTLVEAGLGVRTPESLEALLTEKDRRNAGPTAPAQGLYLYRVLYDPDPMPAAERGGDLR